MKQVTIYSKETCPYCDMAKKLLSTKMVTKINEIRIDLDETKRSDMIERTGRMTVPQIFIGDFHVGGFDDLAKLNRDGQLDNLLKE